MFALLKWLGILFAMIIGIYLMTILLYVVAGLRSQSENEQQSSDQWHYSVQGGDARAYPGPNSWYMSMGFTCHPRETVLRFQGGNMARTDPPSLFSLRFGSEVWNGPARVRRGMHGEADIPIEHPIVGALSRLESGSIEASWDGSAYNIPHDAVVRRVAAECRSRASSFDPQVEGERTSAFHPLRTLDDRLVTPYSAPAGSASDLLT